MQAKARFRIPLVFRGKAKLESDFAGMQVAIQDALDVYGASSTVSGWISQSGLVLSTTLSEEKYSFKQYPYFADIVNAYANPQVKKIVLMTSSQIGKTEATFMLMAWISSFSQSRILVVYPKWEFAKEVAGKRFGAFLENNPVIARNFKPRDKTGRNSTTMQLQYAHRSHGIIFVGAGSAVEMKSRTIDTIIADEIDEFPRSQSLGNPIEALESRVLQSKMPKIILLSTPVSEGRDSFIRHAYRHSSQGDYVLLLPRCGHDIVLDPYKLRWFSDTDEYGFECGIKGCKTRATEFNKSKMLSAGYWRHTKPKATVQGFHLNQCYSPSVPWRDIFDKREEVFASPTLTTTLAERQAQKQRIVSFQEHVVADKTGAPKRLGTVSAMRLLNAMRMTELDVDELDSILDLHAGVDVQGDRLELMLMGLSNKQRICIVDYRIFEGDTSFFTHRSQPWQGLLSYCESKLKLPIQGLDAKASLQNVCMDFGFRKNVLNRLLKFATMQFGSNFLLPALGETGYRASNHGRKKIEPVENMLFTGNYEGVPFKFPGLKICTTYFKDMIFEASFREGMAGIMTLFAAYGLRSYICEGLHAEEKSCKTGMYEKIDRNNEPLDTLVYALVAQHCWQMLKKRIRHE